MRKYVITLFIIAVTCFSTLTYGQEQTETEVQQISDWAVKDMHEAEAAQILPLDWTSTLHNPITEQQSKYIGEGLAKKFESIGLEKQYEIEKGSVKTRGQVLDYYYDIINAYGLIEVEDKTVNYMDSIGVISGTDPKALRLDDECTVQEAVVFANRVLRYIYGDNDSGAKGLLWEVSDEDNTVYLLGTIHLVEENNYPFHSQLNTAIKEVDKVAFEVDFYDYEGFAYLQQKQMYVDGPGLNNYIPEELYTQVVEAGAMVGVQEADINMLKPWAVSNLFTYLISSGALDSEAIQDTDETEVISPLPVIDMYVYTRALLEGKEIIELEGYKYQADLFDGISLEAQIKELETTTQMVLTSQEEGVEANQAEESLESIELWLDCFYEGNEEQFDEAYPKDEMLESESELTKMLFDTRDDNMSQTVLDYLKDTESNYMVVVGAGHMVGEEGIVQQVIDAGYDVRPVE